MSDDDREMPSGRRRPTLGVDPLRVNLEPLRLIPELRAKLESGELLRAWESAEFELDAPRWNALDAPQPAPGEPTPPAKPADIAQVSKAIFETPLVKDLLKRLSDEAQKRLSELEREWKSAGGGGKAGMVAAGALVGGGMIGALLGAEPTRRLAFEWIKGKDIPVPGVDGLTLKLLDAGAAIGMPTAVPGLRVTFHAAALDGSRPDYGVMVGLDLAKLLPGL